MADDGKSWVEKLSGISAPKGAGFSNPNLRDSGSWVSEQSGISAPEGARSYSERVEPTTVYGGILELSRSAYEVDYSSSDNNGYEDYEEPEYPEVPPYDDTGLRELINAVKEEALAAVETAKQQLNEAIDAVSDAASDKFSLIEERIGALEDLPEKVTALENSLGETNQLLELLEAAVAEIQSDITTNTKTVEWVSPSGIAVSATIYAKTQTNTDSTAPVEIEICENGVVGRKKFIEIK